MKVREVMAVLEGMDPDADVYVMTPEYWLFECSIAGICRREEFTKPDPEAEPLPPGECRWSAPGASLPMNDVFIFAEWLLRPGSYAAWAAVRRR